jgi:uncharacterized protein YcbX
MPELRLTALYRYPVKSLGGQELHAVSVDRRGPEFDRHWMLVDPQGRFLTQRQHPRMALIRTRFGNNDVLVLQAPGMPDLEVIAATSNERIEVRIWDDTLPGSRVGDGVDDWLRTFLGVPCHLIALPEDVRRSVDPSIAAADDQVGLADGFPFLLISQASLDDLNARMQVPLPMLRFRPNLVVAGCEPHAEDGWRRIRIGDMGFRVAKPCSRCIIPTIDPDTGERGREPMQTLLGYRRRDNKVYFGQNLIHDGIGRLHVGMSVEVLE